MVPATRLTLESALADLTAAVDRLAGGFGPARRLPEVAADRNLPPRGGYFFLDPAEPRADGGARIVRVGTHALKAGSTSTLRQRLSQHRGTVGAGLGNHRGSIFRLLVGQALIATGAAPPCPTWGIRLEDLAGRDGFPGRADTVAAEAAVERAVSGYMAGLQVAVLPVPDPPGPESLRGVVERGAIALLAEAGRRRLVEPGAGWLGRASNRPAVRATGLWNQNHVDEPWSAGFLDHLGAAP